MSKQSGPPGQRFRVIDEADRLKAEMELERARQQRSQQQSHIYRPKIAPSWLTQKSAEEVHKPAAKPLEPPKPAPREERFRAEVVREQFKSHVVRPEGQEQPVVEETESSPSAFVIADFSAVEPLKTEAPVAVEAEEEDDAAGRRAMLRRRQIAREAEEEEARLEKQRQAAAARVSKEAISSSESSDSSESESESEEEFRPVFVKKEQRVILQKQEDIEMEEALAELELQKRAMERKAEARQLAIDILQREEEAKEARLLSGENLPDDEDKEEEELEALRAWKTREMARVARDYAERMKIITEYEEKEKLREEQRSDPVKKKQWREFDRNRKVGVALMQRREMMDREDGPNKARDRRDIQDAVNKRVGQRGYSKGAFTGYIDESDELFKRDYSVATGEDAYRHLLGRGKYTSLADEDTTRLKDELTTKIEASARMAGTVADIRFNRDDHYRRQSTNKHR